VAIQKNYVKDIHLFDKPPLMRKGDKTSFKVAFQMKELPVS
jgi:hypothetical protein